MKLIWKLTKIADRRTFREIYYKSIRNYQKCTLLIITIISFIAVASCRFSGIGGAGWDDKGDVEIARQYPAIESSRTRSTHICLRAATRGRFRDRALPAWSANATDRWRANRAASGGHRAGPGIRSIRFVCRPTASAPRA